MTTKLQKRRKNEKNKRRNALGTEASDKRDPTGKPEEETQYIRSQNMCIKYQETITKTSGEGDKLFFEDTYGMTQHAIENR